MARWPRSIAAMLGFVGLLAGTSRAHVEYVIESPGRPMAPGRFLVDVVREPVNAALLTAAGLTVVAGVAGYHRARPLQRDRAALLATLAEYDRYLPWMLRLSVGLPLVGAGFAGYYFAPTVGITARPLLVGIGFLLLFGLASRVAAAVGLLAFAVGLLLRPELILALEYVGGLAGIILVGSGRPSADHLLKGVADAAGTVYGRFDPVHRLANRVDRRLAPQQGLLPLLIRVPLGLNFVYLGVREKLLTPGVALEVVSKYGLVNLVPVDPGLWVVGAGLVEFGVGLALLFGAYTRSAAALAFLTLTLTLFGLPDDPVLAHVTLFGLTSAMFVTGAGPLSVDRWLADRG